MIAITNDLLNPAVAKKNYSYKPASATVAAIEKLLEDHKNSLLNDDPNDLEDKINVKAARVSRPAKETFASEKAIIDLHLDLYKGDKSADYEKVILDVDAFIAASVSRVVETGSLIPS